MKRFFTLIAAALLSGQIANSQSLSPTVIASAGGYSEAGGISLSWTLGEVAVSTLEAGGLILTQGFQQSYLNDVGFDLDPILWQIIAYPNPVYDELKVQFDVPDATDFLIEIQDLTGRLLSQLQFKEILQGDIVPIEMSPYKSGSYFLRISTSDRKQVRVLSIKKL